MRAAWDEVTFWVEFIVDERLTWLRPLLSLLSSALGLLALAAVISSIFSAAFVPVAVVLLLLCVSKYLSELPRQ